MTKKNFFDIVLDIVLILLAILITYWAIQLIFGGNPELSQFNSAFIVLLIGFFVRIYREVGEVKVGIKHGFNNMKKDMDLIRKDINFIKGKLK